jgi:hypothetical protein
LCINTRAIPLFCQHHQHSASQSFKPSHLQSNSKDSFHFRASSQKKNIKSAKMQFSTALLALPALAAAAPVATPANSPITLMSVRSASPIQYGQINASGQGFWIGKNTATYCPSGVSGLDCSTVNNSTTVVETGAVNTASGASLYDEVPGGQQLYVAKNGAVGYTIAHSAAIPSGAYTTGFVYTPPASGQPYGHLSFNAGGATGFLACPTTASGYPYQIYADVKGANTTNCLGFDAFAIPYTGAPAWQYT